MAHCPDCGVEVSDGDSFCQSCGAKLSDSSPTYNSLKEQLQAMDNYDFEHFVADLWEQQGWEATVSQASVDAGIDVIAEKDDLVKQKQVIQAKRYGPNTSVGGPDVQQYASLENQVEGADSVAIVTTGRTTSAAEDRARELNVKLVDGDDLVRIINDNGAHDLVQKYSSGAHERSSDTSSTSSSDVQIGSSSDRSLLRRSVIFVSTFISGLRENLPERDVYGQEIPRTVFTYLIIGTVVGWFVLYALLAIDPPDGSPLAMFAGVVVLVSWGGLPLGLFVDPNTVSRYSDWRPHPAYYAIAGIVPYVNSIVGLYYLYRRRQVSKQATSEVPPSSEQEGDSASEEKSTETATA